MTAIAINSMPLTGKLPEGDKRWYGFNQSFQNEDVDLIDFANKVYQGHAYTSWHSPCVRHSDNWQQSQFIAVDMDTGDERSSFAALTANDFVMSFASMLHTTPSHTPENPRARVIFLLDRPIVHPTSYSNACKFVSSILGGDRVATDPSRFFYGNLNAEIEILRGVLPVNYLYTLYKRSHKADNLEKRPDVAPSVTKPTSASHKTHYNPNEDKRQTIRDALDKINPWDLEYLEWVSVVAAIKHELGDEGLAMAETWANGKKGEVEKMWRSFRRESGRVAGIPTIVHFAKLKA